MRPHPSILQLGNPVLRSTTIQVEEFDRHLANLAASMVAVMRQAGGIGLAAPQVGSLARIAIVPGDKGQPLALVNPVSESLGEGREVAIEACLSITGIELPVERERAVKVQAQDLSGESMELNLEGLQARAAQHEIDHLDGVLILDRVAPDLRWLALRSMIHPKSDIVS